MAKKKLTNRQIRVKQRAMQARVKETTGISTKVSNSILMKKIADTNEEILIKLSEIEENQIDEQDTSIKAKKLSEETSPKTEEKEEKVPAEDEGFFSSLFKNLLTGLIGVKGMSFLRHIKKVGLAPFKMIDKFKSFTKDIIPRTIKAVMNKLGVILKNIPGVGAALNKVSAVKTKAVDKVKSVKKNIIDRVKPKTDKIKTPKQTKPGFFSKVYNTTKNSIVNSYSNIKNKLAEKFGNITKFTSSKAGVSLAEKTSRLIGPKALTSLKLVAKKIPGISIIAGLGFGAQRAVAGDFAGAGLEVLSGLASTIPGIGTLASVGLDGALIKRDMDEAIIANTSKMNRAGVEVPKVSAADVQDTSPIEKQKSNAEVSGIAEKVSAESNKSIKEQTKDRMLQSIAENTKASNQVQPINNTTNTSVTSIAQQKQEYDANNDVMALFNN